MSENKGVQLSLEDLGAFMVRLRDRLDDHYRQTGDAQDAALAWEAGQVAKLVPDAVKIHEELVKVLKDTLRDLCEIQHETAYMNRGICQLCGRRERLITDVLSKLK